MVSSRSAATAPISIARTPSAISSPAPGPVIPMPRTLPESGSRISLVRPSSLPMVVARPDAAQGNRVTVTLRPASFAPVSVRPHQATSGSVNTTAGIASGSNATFSPAMDSTATFASWLALWASIGCPTRSPMAQMVGSAVRSCSLTWTNPLSSRWTPVFSRPRFSEFGRRPTETRMASNVIGLSGACFPSKVTLRPDFISWIEAALVPRKMFSNRFLSLPARGRTRSGSAPARMPSIISTTVTLLPRAA